ncbi:MAG: pyridoxamine 5'-phosphate oxidase family protein [Candidatus Heimdallarchaeota archaeon]|nr:pyridoxamine 5'-phosphate oxidase family protein [Candidatus Heimdallarchaeota archaeon]MCK4955261.1 pyridoxamine 5'-phosphate oxidase family protein [Candidatus Heimdallarchaeota archaeon]
MKDLVKEVRKIMKNNNWLVLSTANEKGHPQSSVIMYESDGNNIYFTTGKNTLKSRNIRKNPNVSITIPFFKNLLHKFVPAPPAELHFKAKAEFLERESEEVQTMLARIIEYEEKVRVSSDSVYIKITPGKKVATYGVGIKLLEMRFPEKARNLIVME